MDSSTKIIITYMRQGGRKPPRDREILEINGNREFSLWRSIGAATFPPSPVGRFSGILPPSEFDLLQSLIDECNRTGSLNIPPLPDASVETITLANVQASLSIHAEPSGVWGSLIGKLRNYLKTLTRYPQSALKIEILPPGSIARLAFMGSVPIQVDFSKLTLRAVVWNEYRKVGDWSASQANSGLPTMTQAGNNWFIDIPMEHNFVVEHGLDMVAYVSFTLFDKETPVPVSLESDRFRL